MKLYLAAAWSRKDEISAVAGDLVRSNDQIEITSRWLQEPVDLRPGQTRSQFRQERAQHDIEDVAAADILVRFTDDLTYEKVPARLATGARMFEMGYAYALGKEIVVVGGVQPIFDYLPSIVHVSNVDALKRYLFEKGIS